MKPPVGTSVTIPPEVDLFSEGGKVIERTGYSYCMIIRWVSGCNCCIATFDLGDSLFGCKVLIPESFFYDNAN